MEDIRKRLACEILVDLDSAGPGPLHERLTRVLRMAIRDGVLGAGAILPPSRALASDLGCSRWVVTQAYDQLVAEGYLVAKTGSATRVRPIHPAPERSAGVRQAVPRTAKIDLTPGLPDLREFPRKRWSDAARSQLATIANSELGHPAVEGASQLREALAGYLRRVRGADSHAEHITICASVTDGVSRLSAALLANGIHRIGVEDPGWARLRDVLVRAGLEVVGIPVDAHGIDVGALAAHSDLRAVLVTPAHQFPTGVVLSPDRRGALLDWANRVDGLILEDDYDAEFRYDRRPVGTLQGADSSRVTLFGSLSKTLSPSVGIGWMATPPRWTSRIRDLWSPPSALEQLTFAAFLATGEYDRHLRGARQRYRRRRDLLVGELRTRLPGCRLSGIAAGLHLVLHLAGVDADFVVRQTASRGVRVVALDSYRIAPDPADPALVLGYGNLADRSLSEAVGHLANVIEAGADHPRQPIRT